MKTVPDLRAIFILLLLLAVAGCREPLPAPGMAAPTMPATAIEPTGILPSPVLATVTPLPSPTVSPLALSAETLPDLHEFATLSAGTRLFSVDIAPDRTRLAAGTLGGEILLYNLPERDLVAVQERHGSRVYRLLFSPDGGRLYSASRDGTVQVWDALTGERLFAVRTPREASALALSPDGGTFAAGGYYSARGVVWDSREGALLSYLEGHETRFRSLAFSPDGALLATGDFDGVVILRDTLWYDVITRLDFDWGEAASLAFSPDSSLLAVGMSQTHLFIYDLNHMALLHDLAAHGGSVNDLVFAPGSSLLVSAGVDGDIGFWDAQTGENRRFIATGGGSLNDLAITPDGELMATAGDDGLIRLYAILP